MTASLTRRLESTANGSSKFWAVDVTGTEARVSYGKIGSAGRETVKSFKTPQEAQAFAEKKIAEKIRGGYSDVSTFVAAASQPSAPPTVLGAAASAPTPGGVMQVRLGNTSAAAPTTLDLKTHYRRAAYQLPRARDGFAEVIQTLKDYNPKQQTGPLARLFALDPNTIPELEAKQKEFENFLAGPAKPLMADPLTGSLSAAELQPIHDALAQLSQWASKGVKFPSMMMQSGQLMEKISAPLRFARMDLPNLDALTAPRLTAKAFAALDEGERAHLIQNAERHGYEKEDLGDDEGTIRALIGDAGIKTILAHVLEEAESDAEQWPDEEDDVEIGDPSLLDLYVVKSGNEILGYQVETHINWEPADQDIIGVHMVMPDGTLFGEDRR